MTHTAEIELDEFALPTAVLRFDVTRHHADPDVGVYIDQYEVNATISRWDVGMLKLSRADMVVAIGIEAVEDFEGHEAEKYAAELDAGNGSDCDDRFDVAQDDA